MTNVNSLLNKTENGFNSLEVSKKYVDSALTWLETWLTDHTFKDYVPQIAYLIETEKWGFLLDSFYQVIPFGTGGRRGLVPDAGLGGEAPDVPDAALGTDLQREAVTRHDGATESHLVDRDEVEGV